MRTDRGLRGSAASRRLGRPLAKSELDFNFVLGDRIASMNPAHWDTLAIGKSLLLSRDLLGNFEETGPRSINTRYGMIFQKDVPVAAAVVHVVNLPAERIPTDTALSRRGGTFHMLNRPVETAFELGAPPAAPSVLICGDYYAGGFHGVLLRDENELGKLWPALTTLLQKIALQEGLKGERDFILLKDVPTTVNAETRLLRNSQYRRVDSSPNMILPLLARWKRYEDYLAHLNVRCRLSAVRSARDLLKQGVTFKPLTDLAGSARRLHELYMNVQRRVGQNVVLLPEEFLPALALALGTDQFRCTGLFRAEDLLGFAFTLKDRDTAICYCLGWDTDAGQQSPMLPALLHRVVADALELGCGRVNFGRTALRAKAQVGAYPEQSEVWIHHTRAELDLPVSQLLDTISHAPYGDQSTPLPL